MTPKILLSLKKLGCCTYQTRKNFWKLKYDSGNRKFNGPHVTIALKNQVVDWEAQAKKFPRTQNNNNNKTQEIKEKV